MKVGDLVKHWLYDYGFGTIVTTVLPLTGHVHPKQETEITHKVVWPDGEYEWIVASKLEKVAVCK
jgi:hypothetical protein